MPIIDSTTDGIMSIPGSYSVDYAGSGLALSDKYVVAAGATLFPGLFAFRSNLSNAFTQANSGDQLTTPGPEDIIGLVAWTVYGASSGSSLAYADMTPIAAGKRIQLIQNQPGWALAFAGEAIDGTALLGIAATKTGTAPNTVYAGSLVTATYSGAVAALGLVSLNPLSDGVSFKKGDLVPVSIEIINR
jgi:hypothetical protein